MFESFGPEEWTVFISIAGLMLAMGAGTLRYAFKVERNTGETAASNNLILNSLNSHKAKNNEDHREIHGRINEIDSKVDKHGEKIAKHEVHIGTLLNKDCQ